MSTSAASFPTTYTRSETRASVPWTIWAGIAAVTSSMVGGTWDVSWHRSIGRDTFLTPAHVMIYACGVIAAVVCGYLVLATTFGKSETMKAQSVSVLGFRAPLGAFIAAWGGIAMLTSAPFDNWWHNAYGLDVKIISPPHTLLILGTRGVSIGVLFLITAAMNRTGDHTTGRPRTLEDEASYRTLRRLMLYMGGLLIIGQMFFIMIQTWDIELHSTLAYIVMAIALPGAFAVIARASGYRWACTTMAAIYTAYILAEIIIFPFVPASPKLGPVFFPVTHLVPGKFPILILIPAIALDLLWDRLRTWKPWQIALVSGVVFVVLLVAVEWPFATFLLSKASENRFFGTIYFDYNSRPNGPDRMREFVDVASGIKLFTGLAWASVFAAVSTWIGLKFGNWMRGIQR
jgi:hypothetical protein